MLLYFKHALALYLCIVKLELGVEPVVMGMKMDTFIEIFRNEGGFSYRQKYSGLADGFNSEDWL